MRLRYSSRSVLSAPLSDRGRRFPFILKKNYGLRPGITGFAQINQEYDETIDDVRRKLLFDHGYAAHLSSPLRLLIMDCRIVFGTIAIMVMGRGQ